PDPRLAFARDDARQAIEDLAQALYVSRICAYAQGMALIRIGSDEHHWNINLAEIARIWKGGCIIRARLLDPVRQAFAATSSLAHLPPDPGTARVADAAQAAGRRVAGRAPAAGIPVPAHAAALAYFDAYRSARLPQNLTQAQRDAFGAHTYERVDR